MSEILCSRRTFITMTMSSAALSMIPRAHAQAAYSPDRQIEIVVGTDPGSGFDRTARMLQKTWHDDKLLDVPVTVVNKPGGNFAIGWVYLNQHVGSGDYVSIISPNLLSNQITGASTLSYKDVTPLSILVSEAVLFAASPGSNIKTGTDLIAKLKKDPASVSVAMSGIGGQNHIALGLVAEAAGVDVTKMKVVGYSGGGDALTAVLGSHVDLLVLPVSSVQPQVQSGGLIALATTGDARIDGPLSNIPTWKEQGINVSFSAWRGLIGPKAMPASAVAFWDDILGKTTQAPDWKAELASAQVTNAYLNSDQTKAFLVKEDDKVRSVLQALHLSKAAN